MERNDRKILEKMIHYIEAVPDHGRSKYGRIIVETIQREEFLMAMFAPQWENAKEKDEIHASITQIYEEISRKGVISAIAWALENYGYGYMDRTGAVFLVSLVNLGMAKIDSDAQELGRKKDHDDISTADYDRRMKKLAYFQSDLQVLLEVARGVVKKAAKELSKETGMPREMCQSALFSVPSPKYLSPYKIGFYLKIVMGNLYGFANYSPDYFEYGYDEIDWNVFFATVFGKSRVPDVASLVLLEGVDTIERYDNRREVKACWDAVTNFALRSLNRAPESIRDQMIELYLKRLNKALADHNIGLRVDLRMIDEFRFDKLAKTIDKYKQKIDTIMDAASKLRGGPRPDTSPV